MKILVFIMLLGMLPIVNSQSIGIIPRTNEIEVYTNEPTITDIRLSQAAAYNEMTTIEPAENYDWVNISETNFVLEPGVRKIVNINIFTKENGRYEAEFKICARGSDTGTLTVVACTEHDLIVNSVTNPATIIAATAITAGSIIFVSGIGFLVWRNRKMRMKKSKRSYRLK